MKINKIILILVLLVFMGNIVYGVNASYTLTEVYKFKNGNNYSEVELFLGTTDNSEYSKGNCVIKPNYLKLKKDDYGNLIAVFNNSVLKENNYTIEIHKNIVTTNVINDIKSCNVDYNVSDIYLKPSSKIESENDLIINKAKELTNGCVDDYSKIRNIFEFVNMNITYDVSEKYRNKGALSALKTGRGVCEEYASLFVALCRASNIPARVIAGYNVGDMLEGEEKNADSLAHAWAEVYLKDFGWLPIEATTYYTINYEQVVYWKGLFNLEKPTYIFSYINNPDYPQILYKGLDFVKRETKVKLNYMLYFEDITNHWAKSNIENLYNKSIIKGYEDDTFRPENNVTRIEFLVMLSRSLNYKNSYFYNCDKIYYPIDFENNWAKNDYDKLMLYYAYAASDNDLINGAGFENLTYVFGDKIEMNKYITREEVVALMAPFLQNTYAKNVPLKDIEDSKFKEEIKKSYLNNIIRGYEDGSFSPKGNITRAEMSTILDRYTK